MDSTTPGMVQIKHLRKKVSNEVISIPKSTIEVMDSTTHHSIDYGRRYQIFYKIYIFKIQLLFV